MPSETQDKRVVTLQIDRELLARVDARAARMERSRAWFMRWALENALDDAGRGVPDAPLPRPRQAAEVPPASPGTPRAAAPPAPAREMDWQEIEMARRRAKR